MSFTMALGFTPVYQVFKGGEDITSNLNDRVTSIKVESHEGGGDSDHLDISIDDRDRNIDLPSIGEGSATLDLLLGYKETSIWPLGSFEVDELTLSFTPFVMLLHGNSAGFESAAKSPMITSYDNQTLGQVVSAIAQAAGVSPAVDPELAQKKIPFLNQHQSPLHLLQQLEREYNALAHFQDGMLSFTRRGTGLSVSGQSIGYFVLGPEDFGNGSIRLTNRHSYSKVRACWWDKDTNQIQWLQSTISGSPNSDVPYLIKRGFASQQQAQAAANAKMAALNRQEKQGNCTLAKGMPEVRGGQSFSIAGVRSGIDGAYIITTVTHVFTREDGIGTMLEFYADPDDDTSDQLTSGGEADFSGTSIST